MAIDTRAKRQSCLAVSTAAVWLNPDAALSQGDRQHLARYYGGILATAPPVTARHRRASAIQFNLPFRMTCPHPDGSVQQVDRQHISLTYSGITTTTASSAVAPAGHSKRASTVQVALPFHMVGLWPDASVTLGDRQHLALSYSALTVTTPATWSRAQRASSVGVGMPFRLIYPHPDGSVNVDDRAHLGGLYTDVSAGGGGTGGIVQSASFGQVTFTGYLPGFTGAGILEGDRGDAPLTASLAQDIPSGQGALTLYPYGAFTYNPQGFVGVTTFTYTASDGFDTSDETIVTIEVIGTAAAFVADSTIAATGYLIQRGTATFSVFSGLSFSEQGQTQSGEVSFLAESTMTGSAGFIKYYSQAFSGTSYLIYVSDENVARARSRKQTELATPVRTAEITH